MGSRPPGGCQPRGVDMSMPGKACWVGMGCHAAPSTSVAAKGPDGALHNPNPNRRRKVAHRHQGCEHCPEGRQDQWGLVGARWQGPRPSCGGIIAARRADRSSPAASRRAHKGPFFCPYLHQPILGPALGS